MWCHLLTIFNRRYLLRFAAIILVLVALTTTLFFASISRAAPGINKTIGFQGRLLDTEGDIVPDGYYNVQFKIYQGGTGTVAGNPGGTLEWTETYINNGNETGGVEVKNGFMSVNLGSKTPFGTSVDWNQDNLWLSMNVAGNDADCSTFGTGPCIADGEMLPMKQMTATPYALNAGSLGGKSADNFIQLAQGVQTDASSNTSSVFINKTGTGHLLQLQKNANDVFTVTNSGDLMLGSADNHAIFINTSAPNTDGRQLAVSAGNGGSGTGTNGGTLSLQGGNAGGTNGNSGSVQIDAGAKTGTGNYGYISIGATNAGTINIGSNSGTLHQDINIGSNNTAGSSTDVTIGAGGSASSGTTNIQAKNAVTIATNGVTRATFSDTTNTVYFGNGVTASTPNDYTIQGTNSSTNNVDGGSLAIQGGDATTGNANGGDVVISGGSGNGSGTSGLVVINTPTFSTTANDANCYTGGALVAASCSITLSSVNNYASIIAGFSVVDQTASLPDPTNKTAGRIMYITGADGSEPFTLAINGGGTNNQIAMQPNTTATLLWNGSDWTIASAPAGNSLFTTSSGAAEDTLSVKIGNGDADGETTLFTVDKAGSAPVVTDSEALLGSMYYDTTIGELQCYEAAGWGSCGARPDTFVTLTPEYSNAVMHGNEIGTITSDICSDALDINDGSSAQPEICGVNETYHYYDWTTTELSTQTKTVFVNYTLPANFNGFIDGSTSLKGRIDGDATAQYDIYRNDASGLTQCNETSLDISSTIWEAVGPSRASDPESCSFAAGDSIVFKITLGASNNGHAYISDLSFAYKSR